MLAGLKAALALITLVNKVLDLAQYSNGYAAGKAAAILEATNEVTAMVTQAAALRAAAAAADPAKLRDPDPHSRT